MYTVIMDFHAVFCLTRDRRFLHSSGRQSANFWEPRYVKCINQVIIWTVSTKLGSMVTGKTDALAAALIHTLIINLYGAGDLCEQHSNLAAKALLGIKIVLCVMVQC